MAQGRSRGSGPPGWRSAGERRCGGALRPCRGRTGLAADESHATCTPEERAVLVETGPGSTAFVGDGVNDALAIVRANVGIAATGALPATIALADVVIAKGCMMAAGRAIATSRRARRVLRQNLAFPVPYNALALGLAAGGKVTPLAAAVAMAANSLKGIANAGRLYAAPLRQRGAVGRDAGKRTAAGASAQLCGDLDQPAHLMADGGLGRVVEFRALDVAAAIGVAGGLGEGLVGIAGGATTIPPRCTTVVWKDTTVVSCAP